MSWLPSPPTPSPPRLHKLPPPYFMMLSLLYISQTCFVGLNRLVCIGRLFMCALSSSLEYFTTLGARNWQLRLISSSSSIQLRPFFVYFAEYKFHNYANRKYLPAKKSSRNQRTIFMTLLRFKASRGEVISLLELERSELIRFQAEFA